MNPNTYIRKMGLKPDALGGKNAAVLTVSAVETDERFDRQAIVIHFAEFPEHEYVPNMGSLRVLFDALGTDVDEWIGERVPLQVVDSESFTQPGRTVQGLWVVPRDEWAAILNPAAPSSAKTKRAS